MAIEYLDGGRIIGLSTDTKPTDADSGSTFIETDTGYTQTFNGTCWFTKPFDSINDSFGRSLGYTQKQHFVEWFSGHSLDDHVWNTGNSNAGYTIEMDNSVNGGLKMINNASHTHAAKLDFNLKRQFSSSASTVIYVGKTVTSSGGTIIGLGGDYRHNNAYKSTAVQWDAGNSGGTVYILSGDGTQQSATSTGISRDANRHVYKLENKRNSIACSVDGVQGTSKTTNLPNNNNDKMQPLLSAYSYSGNTTTLNINYYEAYDT